MPSPAQDVLRLARSTVARRHRHLDLPSGEVYVTTPGSALLFPSLCAPTAHAVKTEAPDDRGGERTAKMPTRQRTRSQNRAARITTERQHNKQDRHARQQALLNGNDQPPPF